ncbi:MAG: LptF/LptG family permease, partial [Elusimicrobia bacterium]|nr:LptF/LptG family permease [Elusimicrobiota bacterium]
MKILTRYVMKSFFIPFAAGIFVFSLLIFLGNFFERLDSLIKSPASLWAILQFLWLETPYWMVLIIPIATLTASMLAIGGWIRSREYLAFQAAGIAPAQMLRPLFYCASLVALLSFAAQETVLPYCYWKSQEIFREQIEPRYSQKQTVWTKIVLVGGPGQFLIVEEFDLGAKRMRRVVMDQYEGDRLLGQVDASEAAWDPAGETWVFSHGVQRDFAGGAVREKKFDRFVSNLTTPPQQLIPPKKRPEEMSLRELRRYSKTLKRLGLSTR